MSIDWFLAKYRVKRRLERTSKGLKGNRKKNKKKCETIFDNDLVNKNTIITFYLKEVFSLLFNIKNNFLCGIGNGTNTGLEMSVRMVHEQKKKFNKKKIYLDITKK